MYERTYTGAAKDEATYGGEVINGPNMNEGHRAPVQSVTAIAAVPPFKFKVMLPAATPG